MVKMKNLNVRLDLQEILEDFYDLYAYINGEFVKGNDARISIWDYGLMYGDGVFEGIRCYNSGIFKLDDHIDRLYGSAKAIGIEDIPLSKREMKLVVIETVKRNSLSNAHIRIIVTRGPGKPGINPKRTKKRTVIITAYPYPAMYGGKIGLRLITSAVRAKSPHSIDAKIKCLDYLDHILAKIQAQIANADDALILDNNSCVAEGTGANVFVVSKSTLYTPFLTAALAGITRATVMELAAKVGYKVFEKDITVYDVYNADEVFLTGTGTEISPVAEVDGRRIGTATPGPITSKLQRLYVALVNEEFRTLI